MINSSLKTQEPKLFSDLDPKNLQKNISSNDVFAKK